MIPTSEAYKTELANDNRNFYCLAEITFWNGDTLTVENDKIWQDGFRFKNAVSGQSTFEIGACVINEFTLILNNVYGDFDGYDFDGAKIVAKIGLYGQADPYFGDPTFIDIDGEGGKTFQKGEFYVDEVDTNGTFITLTCLDAMANLDVDYSTVGQTFPATLADIVQNICTACKVPYTPAAFTNSDYEVWSAPDTTSLTCRDALSMVCEIACSWATIAPNGELKISFFDTDFMRSVEPVSGDLDGGTFWTGGDSVDGGIFWNFDVPVHDAGTFTQGGDADHELSGFFKFSRGDEDIRIYGVYVASDSLSYLSGSDVNAVEVVGNMFVNAGDEDDLALDLGDKLIGAAFRPFSCDHLADPSIEAGDTVILTDQFGNVYRSVITQTEFSAGERQRTECNDKTNASQRFQSISNARITGSTFTNGNGDFNVDKEGNVTVKNLKGQEIESEDITTKDISTDTLTFDTAEGNRLTLQGQGNMLSIPDVDEAFFSTFSSRRWAMEWYDPNDSSGFQYYRLRIDKGKLTCYPQDAGSHRMLIDCQTGQIYAGALEADSDITTYFGNIYVDATPLTIQSGYTWATGNRYLTGYMTTGSRDVCFFIPSSRPILASSASVQAISLTVRKNGNYPYARSGSSGGTYTQLGSGSISVWNNGATVRTNEVEAVGCTIQGNDGVNVYVRFKYALVTASGGTTAITNNDPIGVNVNATILFS